MKLTKAMLDPEQRVKYDECLRRQRRDRDRDRRAVIGEMATAAMVTAIRTATAIVTAGDEIA